LKKFFSKKKSLITEEKSLITEKKSFVQNFICFSYVLTNFSATKKVLPRHKSFDNKTFKLVASAKMFAPQKLYFCFRKRFCKNIS